MPVIDVVSVLCFSFPSGRVAALSMMGKPAEVQTVPYFWSAMFGKSIRYAGERRVLFIESIIKESMCPLAVMESEPEIQSTVFCHRGSSYFTAL